MGLPRAARPGGPQAPAGAVPHAGRGSRALSAAVAPGEPPAGSTVRLCVRHEVPGPRARPAVIGGPSQGRESATLPRPEAARHRARARAQSLCAVCCMPGRTLGLSAMTGGWGWRQGARGVPGCQQAPRAHCCLSRHSWTPANVLGAGELPRPPRSSTFPEASQGGLLVQSGSSGVREETRVLAQCPWLPPGVTRPTAGCRVDPGGPAAGEEAGNHPRRCGRWSGSSRSTLLRSSGQLSCGRGRLGRPGVAAARQGPQVLGPRA